MEALGVGHRGSSRVRGQSACIIPGPHRPLSTARRQGAQAGRNTRRGPMHGGTGPSHRQGTDGSEARQPLQAAFPRADAGAFRAGPRRPDSGTGPPPRDANRAGAGTPHGRPRTPVLQRPRRPRRSLRTGPRRQPELHVRPHLAAAPPQNLAGGQRPTPGRPKLADAGRARPRSPGGNDRWLSTTMRIASLPSSVSTCSARVSGASRGRGATESTCRRTVPFQDAHCHRICIIPDRNPGGCRYRRRDRRHGNRRQTDEDSRRHT